MRFTGQAGRTAHYSAGLGALAAGIAGLALLCPPAPAAAPSAVAAAGPPPQAAAARVGAAPAGKRLHLVLGLRRRQDALARFAGSVSDPSSPAYRDYLSIGAIRARFGAAGATGSAVVRALRAAGATGTRVNVTGGFVETDLSAARASALFGARLSTYRGRDGRRFVAPAATPRLPASLRGRVTEVVGLNTLPRLRHATAAPAGLPPPFSRTGTPSGCAEAVAQGGFTPNQLIDAYGIRSLHKRGLKGQGEVIALVEINGFHPTELATFSRCFGIKPPATRVRQVGSTPPDPGGEETTLDTQVIAATAPKLKRLDIYQASSDLSAFPSLFSAPLDRKQNGGRLPGIISSSIGACEAAFVINQETALTEYVLATAAAAGVTVVDAAGDTGSVDCSNSLNQLLYQGPAPAVDYPTSSRYVTSVGGTTLRLDERNHIADQVVWNDVVLGDNGGGGGGSSALYGHPGWQRGPGAKGATRRVPDVAFFANPAPGFTIFCDPVTQCDEGAGWQTIGGTSGGTPLFAAGLALVNQRARQVGQRRLGFINPLLYSLAAKGSRGPVFRDVVKGNNDVFEVGCCEARRNFDRASGWGSLNIGAFSKRALARGD